MTNALQNYVTLGRSGLRVSPVCLGTMTFGTEWSFGVEEHAARPIFDRYMDGGGNFVDTADGYTNGTSEKLVGKFIRERNLRDRVVLATKFTFSGEPGNANAGGNGRKNIYRALEGSLRRLGTDYVDLYWLHAWDTITPVEEVVSTLNDLVRAGKIRHYGFSDTPAWYVARAYTLAEKENKEHLIALQLEYSLLERSIEREHVPVSQELGLAICPWGALASGFLSGKYQRLPGAGGQNAVGQIGDGRLEAIKGTPFQGLGNKGTERNWRILDALLDVSRRMQKPPAQVAQAWALTQPGITSLILGATKLSQLEDTVAAASLSIPAELRLQLDQAGALEPAHPYGFFGGMLAERIRGGVALNPWTAARATGAPASAPAAPREKSISAD